MSLRSLLLDFFTPSSTPDAATRRALARVGELIDPRLVGLRGFERQLVLPIQYALGYCNGLVDSLPGPLNVERRAFATDPLVHALFATGNDIDQMLGKSQAVRDFLNEVDSRTTDHFYALFAARRMEKRQMGVEIHGETVLSDVPQTVLYFSDHTLTEPAASLDAARQRLRVATFDSLLKTFRAHLDELRLEREGVRADLSVERGHLTVLRGHHEGEEVFVQTRRIEALGGRLDEVVDALMPDAVLAALADFLKTPEASLSLEPCSLKVDRMGILANGEGEPEDADTLDFPELISRDRRRYLVTLARVECEEARRSVKEAIDQQRRYVVI